MVSLMPRLRRLALLALALGAVGAFSAPRALGASACPPSPPPTQTISSAHFLVGYSDDPTKTEYISQAGAGTILAAAERAYATYTADGFPTPTVGGSGKTEFYIMDLTADKVSAWYAPGCVLLDKTAVTGELQDFEIGSDVFT